MASLLFIGTVFIHHTQQANLQTLFFFFFLCVMFNYPSVISSHVQRAIDFLRLTLNYLVGGIEEQHIVVMNGGEGRVTPKHTQTNMKLKGGDTECSRTM